MQTDLKYITQDRVQIFYDLPLSEIVFDFYDKLKGAKLVVMPAWIMNLRGIKRQIW